MFRAQTVDLIAQVLLSDTPTDRVDSRRSGRKQGAAAS